MSYHCRSIKMAKISKTVLTPNVGKNVRNGVSHILLVERKNGKLLWMASLTQWTWVWANSRRYWRTGKTGVLQSMESKESDMTEQLHNTLQNRAAVSKTQVIWKLSNMKTIWTKKTCAQMFAAALFIIAQKTGGRGKMPLNGWVNG